MDEQVRPSTKTPIAQQLELLKDAIAQARIMIEDIEFDFSTLVETLQQEKPINEPANAPA